MSRLSTSSRSSIGSGIPMAEVIDPATHRIYKLKGGQAYEIMVTFLVNNSNVMKHLADLLQPTDFQDFASALINIFTVCNRPMQLLHLLINNEFAKHHQSPSTILRLQSVTSRMMGAYLRQVGSTYIQVVMSEIITKIVQDPDADFEIDPHKLQVEATDELLDQHETALRNACNALFEKIIHPDTVAKMPREIRGLAGYIVENCDRYNLDSASPMVGGFIMLRFFNAATVTPEAYDLLPQDCTPSPKARRNLVLMTKVMQNLANGMEFGKKEPYMCRLNSFIRNNRLKMSSYLGKIGVDPLKATTGQGREWEEFSANLPLLEKSVDIHDFDIKDLVVVHRLLDKYSAEVMVARQTELLQTGDTSAPDQNEDFLSLLELLGEPPQLNRGHHRSDSSADRRISVAARRDYLLEMSHQNILEHGESVDTTRLATAEFFYQGKPDKQGVPVFYLIVQRLTPALLADENALFLYIIKSTGDIINEQKYSIVIDMSWATLANETKKGVLEKVQSISKGFTRKQKKNIDAIYIVHPTSFVRNVIWVMKPFVSSKVTRKVHQIYDWKNLGQFIDEDSILLPPESKNVMTKAYEVVKVNSKGKRQERLIKLTANSLMNMDRGATMIKNEKLFLNLKIEVVDDEPILDLKFFDNEAAPSDMPGYFLETKGSSTGDREARRYVCKSMQERDAIVQDIFEASVMAESITFPQAYRGVEINALGKRKDRTFKLTCDSLIKLNANKIRADVHFDGIEGLRIDAENPNILHIKYKFEEQGRQFECPHAETMLMAVERAIERFRESQQRQQKNFDQEMRNQQIQQINDAYLRKERDDYDSIELPDDIPASYGSAFDSF